MRHGETEWSATGKHTGRSDPPLTEKGRAQAELLSQSLAGRSFERVLTSPLARAAETCRLAGLADRAELRDELMEWDYGDYEGLTTPNIRESRPGWFLWRDGVPNGETADEVGARADTVIAELQGLEGDVVLFAHGHVLRVLAARWLELPPTDGAKLSLSTGTLSVLGWERESPAIRGWNLPPGASPAEAHR